jgi:hypothetical protein
METKFCPKCGKNKTFSEFHTKGKENRLNSWCKVCVYDKQKLRWGDRKRKAVELMGGKCQKCGYDKNLACLDFHHIDPATKDKDWKSVRTYKWEKIVEELKKCILVCGNCHGEIHWPDQSLLGNESGNNTLNRIKCESVIRDGVRQGESIVETSIMKPTGKCPFCECDVYGTKYCSVSCSAKDHRKIPKRPSRNKLEKLVWEKSTVQLAKDYGVSDKAVEKWCKIYGIKKPERGYWAKKYAERNINR